MVTFYGPEILTICSFDVFNVVGQTLVTKIQLATKATPCRLNRELPQSLLRFVYEIIYYYSGTYLAKQAKCKKGVHAIASSCTYIKRKESTLKSLSKGRLHMSSWRVRQDQHRHRFGYICYYNTCNRVKRYWEAHPQFCVTFHIYAFATHLPRHSPNMNATRYHFKFLHQFSIYFIGTVKILWGQFSTCWGSSI